jgi:N-acetylmuramate 1-kinase
MNSVEDQKLIGAYLQREKLVAGNRLQLTPLSGDGSDRRFFRIRGNSGPELLAVLPSATQPRARAEARACQRIGCHLKARGVPVPLIYGYDEATGLIIYEDLGNTNLHELARRHAGSSGELEPWYRKAIDALISLQVAGYQGFEPEFCWDTSRYDVGVMRGRESGYFLEAFCRDFLGISETPAGLMGEFEQLAAWAAKEPAHFLLHRDYQSRNLMIRGEEIFIIDFQGARFGPLGYDLASLLLDPYAGLPPELQELLLAYYLKAIDRQLPVDPAAFREGYYFLRLQRNLQIIGAYAFLSRQRNKPFFLAYLLPALEQLKRHLREPAAEAFPCLRELAAECYASMQNWKA